MIFSFRAVLFFGGGPLSTRAQGQALSNLPPDVVFYGVWSGQA